MTVTKSFQRQAANRPTPMALPFPTTARATATGAAQLHVTLLATLAVLAAIVALLLTAQPLAAQGEDEPIQPAAALALPADFVDEAVVGNLSATYAWTYTPDGRILFLERGSATTLDINVASIRVYKNGALLDQRAAVFDVCGDGERGALGITVDPNFASNGFVYLYYSRQGPSSPVCAYGSFGAGNPGPRNRVSRVQMVGDTVVAGSERVLIDTIATDTGIHNGGDLHFGADGNLYISVGDSGIVPSPADDTNYLNGKLLRIRPDTDADGGYTIPADNPFTAASDPNSVLCGNAAVMPASGPCREVFAYGLRNPFRFSIRPGTSSPYIGDVGGGAWEEIDVATSGGNYGYPVREGPCAAGVLCAQPAPPSGYADPIYSYPHIVINANSDSAVIGGAFYVGPGSGVGYPAGYADSYFFADFIRGFMRRLVFNSSNSTWQAVAPDFATGLEGIIGIRPDPSGDLCYMRFLTTNARVHELRCIRYRPNVNQPPVAQLSVTPQSGPLNTIYSYSAAGTTDPDGNLPLTYFWDFGDGAELTTTVASATHQYATAANATTTLVVRDSGVPPANSLPVSVTVYPSNVPPTATIVLGNVTAPARNQKFYAGDTWSYAAVNASDDQPLPADAYEWDVEFHHREHFHPFLSGLTGTSGQFTIPTGGEMDPVIWYRVVLRLTDARGQTSVITKDIFPQTVMLRLESAPVGMTLLLDGIAGVAPFERERVVGLQVSVTAPLSQTVDSKVYRWLSWSDGGAREHPVSVPVAPTTWRATYELVAATPTPVTPAPPTPPVTPTPQARNYLPLIKK